jgi:BASS family bile acid:Na+ symporter
MAAGRAHVFRFWRNFPFMVAAGLVVGFATGGFPPESTGLVQQAFLVVAMAFSLTEISFRGISPRAEARGLALATLMSYGILGALVISFGLVEPNPLLRSGWVLMGAVPPAIAVVPITSLLRGNVRGALISDAVLYFAGLAAVPGLSLLFLGEMVPVQTLAVQTLLLIGLPIVVSRPLRAWRPVHDARATAVCVSFFVLVVAIAGSTRATLLDEPGLAAGLSALAFLRTIGLGLILFLVTRGLKLSRDVQIASLTFAGFKNLGLTVVLAFTVFGALASLPAITALIFEVAWMSLMPLLFRVPSRGIAEIPG